MNRIFALAILVMFSTTITVVAKETNPAVLADYHKHQKKKHKHKHQHRKRAEKAQSVPVARLRNCHQRRFWVAPNRIREAKVCEVR